jgi:copper transport protein
VQTAALTGSDAAGALPQLGTVAFGTVYGALWLARMGSLAVVAATYRRTATARAGGLGVAIILFAIASAANGHALASGTPPLVVLAVASDALHLLAAAVWTAGVLVFATGIPVEIATIRRFTTIATASVVVLLVTGLAGTIIHAGSLGSLLASPYGRLVLAKSALLIPLVALGYRNARRARSIDRTIDITGTVRTEAVLLAAVLLVAAILAGTPTPHHA